MGLFRLAGTGAVSLRVQPWAGELADTGTLAVLEEKGLQERPVPYLQTHPTHVLLAFCKHLCVCFLPVLKKVCFSPSTEAAAEAGVWIGVGWGSSQPTCSTR